MPGMLFKGQGLCGRKYQGRAINRRIAKGILSIGILFSKII